jgi:hypothetical protein
VESDVEHTPHLELVEDALPILIDDILDFLKGVVFATIYICEICEGVMIS